MPVNARGISTPVLRETTYDRVSSWAIALFIAIGMACLGVVALWYGSQAPQKPEAVPVEIIEDPGGFEDGSPDETLKVESPEPEVRDASPAEITSDKTEIAETLEAVVEISENATQIVQQQFETGVQNTGRIGSAKGTGKKGLGIGSGSGGMPREQRWYVRFGDRVPVEEYAKQLDYFGIELGVILPDKRLAYVSKLSQPAPMVRYTQEGTSDDRLYMTWQGGERRSADLSLFKKAGIDVEVTNTIFHFYPKATEATLVQLEIDFRGRPVSQIRRTYFTVEPNGGAYKFTVTQQIPIK